MFSTLKNRPLILLLASLFIFASCSREKPNSISGRVVRIADGDTITILDANNVQHRIRLQGIDAPERRQDFSDVSREHLASLVFGKYVTIEYQKVDRYGRLVGKVWVDGDDECLEQLKAGLAWHYKEYEKEQSPTDQQLYARAEQGARAQKRGLWQDPKPVPPWDFRHHVTGSSAELDSQDESDANKSNARSTPNINSTNASTPVARPAVTDVADGLIRGNKHSMIYHWPGCQNYDDIAQHNRVPFQTREEAERAGYRAARNCP